VSIDDDLVAVEMLASGRLAGLHHDEPRHFVVTQAGRVDHGGRSSLSMVVANWCAWSAPAWQRPFA
jgi:hypothetical protein